MNETLFKTGDKVFDIRYGWGVVKYIHTIDWEKVGPDYLVCEVEFDKKEETYIYTKKSATQMLSFTEYTLQGFSQERPINYDDYIGKWGKFWDTAYENTVIIAKLSSYRLENPYRSFRCYTYGEDSDMGYTNFEPLTEEQTKILNLE